MTKWLRKTNIWFIFGCKPDFHSTQRECIDKTNIHNHTCLLAACAPVAPESTNVATAVDKPTVGEETITSSPTFMDKPEEKPTPLIPTALPTMMPTV